MTHECPDRPLSDWSPYVCLCMAGRSGTPRPRAAPPHLVFGHHLTDERQVLLHLLDVGRAEQRLRGGRDQRHHLLLQTDDQPVQVLHHARLQQRVLTTALSRTAGRQRSDESSRYKDEHNSACYSAIFRLKSRHLFKQFSRRMSRRSYQNIDDTAQRIIGVMCFKWIINIHLATSDMLPTHGITTEQRRCPDA